MCQGPRSLLSLLTRAKCVCQASFEICNSSLSEAAVLGFELGYSLENQEGVIAPDVLQPKHRCNQLIDAHMSPTLIDVSKLLTTAVVGCSARTLGSAVRRFRQHCTVSTLSCGLGG